ncbi:TPA: hypothetical protein ACFP4Y_001451 [Neisseria bacilliformis]|uniref:hypothetical protein n=1 Tax=Neisseria bacilliformis TaxID=267212 RepID=UPI000AEDD17E|nr:hypothetical protein [Neisseria bacilliformis]
MSPRGDARVPRRITGRPSENPSRYRVRGCATHSTLTAAVRAVTAFSDGLCGF